MIPKPLYVPILFTMGALPFLRHVPVHPDSALKTVAKVRSGPVRLKHFPGKFSSATRKDFVSNRSEETCAKYILVDKALNVRLLPF